MTHDQALAVSHAIADMARVIAAIDSEDLGELFICREFCIATMSDLLKAFPLIGLDS